MAKKVTTLDDLNKKYREERKELQLKNYVKLMAALKVLNPKKKEEEIVAIYEAQAKAAKEEKSAVNL